MTKTLKFTSVAITILILMLSLTCIFSTLSVSATETETECDCHYDSYGFCVYCDAGEEPPKLPGSSSTYRVSKPGHLFWFSDAINSGLIDDTSSIWFECDIRIPQPIPYSYATGMFEGDTSKLRQWIPIGYKESDTGGYYIFQGTVYGNGHKLGGLYTTDYAFSGFIGTSMYARIENLHIYESVFSYEDSEITGRSAHVGSIVANASATDIVNCTSEATLTLSHGNAGGILGIANVSSIENCGFWGNIIVTNPSTVSNSVYAGGIAGSTISLHNYGAALKETTFMGCYNLGTLTASASNVSFGNVTGLTQHGTYNSTYVLENDTREIVGLVNRLYIDNNTSTLLNPQVNDTVTLSEQQFKDGTLCEKLSKHPTVNGVCQLCEYICSPHEWVDKNCKHCGTSMRLLNDILAEVPETLFEGDSVFLNAKADPEAATFSDVEWSVESGDATITRGNLLTVGDVGSVTLRATVVNGNGIGEDVSRTYQISVESRTVYDISNAQTGLNDNLLIYESDNMLKIQYNGTVTTVPIGTQIVVTGNHTSDSSDFRIEFSGAFSETVYLKLKDCTISNAPTSTTSSPISLINNVQVNLTLEGNNKLEVKGMNASAIWVKENSKLTIEGTGTLTANAGPGGTAIGCSFFYSGHGDITINSGTINANGGSNSSNGDGGPGIGSTNSGLGGKITINGGTVNAKGGYRSAGIGGGKSSSAGTIVINGGTVTATGYSDGSATGGAGIGNGYSGQGGTVTINGGTVVATGGYNSAGIGGGDSGSTNATSEYGRVDAITINGGVITATGHHVGSDIGAGTRASSGPIVITGGHVIATRAKVGSGEGTSGIEKTSITDGRGNVLTRLTITLDGVGDGKALQSVSGIEYNVDGIETVNGGKLYLWIPENAEIDNVEVGEKTYYAIPSFGDVTFYDHKHNLKFVDMGDGVLALTCTADGCYYDDMGKLEIILPSSLEYTGAAITVSVSDTRLDQRKEYTLTYVGDNLVDGKPIKIGEYSAIISADGVTAKVSFTVVHTDHNTEILIKDDAHIYSCVCGYALSEKHNDTDDDHLCQACGTRCTPCNYVDHYCTVCGEFDAPKPVTEEYYPELYATHAGYYVIKNKEQLVWMSDHINNADDKSMNIVLVSDIQFNEGYEFEYIPDTGLVKITKEGVLVAYIGTGVVGQAIDGGNTTFDSSASVRGWVYTDDIGTAYAELPEFSPIAPLESWAPIGTTNAAYEGIFDGNGHKISGLFINRSGDKLGFIAYLTGTVKNLGIERSFICSQSMFYSGLIVALGENVENCYCHGIVVGDRMVGGIAGQVTNIKNCYSTAVALGSTNVGPVAGLCNNTMENCYYLGTTETDSHNGSVYKTAEAFASGEVAYLLSQNGGRWGQKLGEGGDVYPTVGAQKVYFGYVCDASITEKIYTNSSNVNETEKPTHDLSDATCTQAPICDDCGATVGEALGHDMVTDKAKAPTCTETGLTEGAHCSRCDGATTPQNTVPQLGHNMVTDKAKAPTCTETGLTEGAHCSRCDGATTPQNTVPQLGHDMVTDKAKAPSCTETGLTEGAHCSRCDEATTPQETLPKNDHKWADATHEVPKTCEVCGVTEGDPLPEDATESEPDETTEPEVEESTEPKADETTEPEVEESTEPKVEDTTQSPVKQPTSQTGENNKGGCGSTISAGAVSIVAMITLCGFALKKKKEE